MLLVRHGEAIGTRVLRSILRWIGPTFFCLAPLQPALAANWQAIEGATPNVQVHPVPQNISTTYALAPRICRNYTFQHFLFLSLSNSR